MYNNPHFATPGDSYTRIMTLPFTPHDVVVTPEINPLTGGIFNPGWYSILSRQLGCVGIYETEVRHFKMAGLKLKCQSVSCYVIEEPFSTFTVHYYSYSLLGEAFRKFKLWEMEASLYNYWNDRMWHHKTRRLAKQQYKNNCGDNSVGNGTTTTIATGDNFQKMSIFSPFGISILYWMSFTLVSIAVLGVERYYTFYSRCEYNFAKRKNSVVSILGRKCVVIKFMGCSK